MERQQAARSAQPPAAAGAAASGTLNAALQSEVALLRDVLTARSRRRIYRHHLFLIAALHALRRCAQPVRRRSGTRTLRALVRAGEEAANELRLHRIDTMPICLALLALFARLHFIVSRMSAQHAVRRTAVASDQLPTKRARADVGVTRGPDLGARGSATTRIPTLLPHALAGAGRATLGAVIDAVLDQMPDERRGGL